jgi:hypothetical protein
MDFKCYDRADRKNDGKPQLSYVDLKSLEPCARALEYGANKYSRNNWKKGQPASQILDSLMRHISALQDGEEVDAESGLPHIAHIQANAMFLGHKSTKNDLLTSEVKCKHEWSNFGSGYACVYCGKVDYLML